MLNRSGLFTAGGPFAMVEEDLLGILKYLSTWINQVLVHAGIVVFALSRPLITINSLVVSAVFHR